MDSSHLLAVYDEQCRAAAEVADLDEVLRVGPVLVGLIPARGRAFITHAPLPADIALPVLVDEVLAVVATDRRIDEAEWKTRGHDEATLELHALLAARGFVVDEVETVMLGEATAALGADAPLPEGYRLERAEDEQGMRQAEALAGKVFGDSPERSRRRADELVDRMNAQPGSFEMWLVRAADGGAVCSGRIDLPPGIQVAGLWGGACDEEHRGKGLYRAVTAARARTALAAGRRYLQSDCTEFSRPILQRAGLVAITTTTPLVWHRRP